MEEMLANVDPGLIAAIEIAGTELYAAAPGTTVVHGGKYAIDRNSVNVGLATSGHTALQIDCASTIAVEGVNEDFDEDNIHHTFSIGNSELRNVVIENGGYINAEAGSTTVFNALIRGIGSGGVNSLLSLLDGTVASSTQVGSGGMIRTGAGTLVDTAIESGGIFTVDGAAKVRNLTMEDGSVFDWGILLAGTEFVDCVIAGQKSTFSAVGDVVTDYTRNGGSFRIGDGVTVKNLTLINLDYNTFTCGSNVTIDGLTLDCAGFGNNSVNPVSARNITIVNGWTSWRSDIENLTISQKTGGYAYLATSAGGTVTNPGRTITITNVNITAGALYLGEVNVGGSWDGEISTNTAVANNVEMSGGTLFFRSGVVNNLHMTGGSIVLADRGLNIKGTAPKYEFNGDVYMENATVNRGGTTTKKDGTQTQPANVNVVLTSANKSMVLKNTTFNTNLLQASGVSATVTIRGTGTAFSSGYKLQASKVVFDLTDTWFSSGSSINSLDSIEADEMRINGRLAQGDYILGTISGSVDDLTIRQDLLDETPYNLKYKLPGPMTAEYITIHNTANSASAAAERNYLNSRQDNQYISFHFAVDETEAVQIMPLDIHGWHAGDGHGDGNMKSIGIEICRSTIYSSDIYYRAEANAVKLAAYLLYVTGLTVDDLRMHYDWSGKICPHRIIEDKSWESFKQRVAAVRVAMPVFKATFGGQTFDITFGEVVEVNGYTVTLVQQYDSAAGANVAKLSVRSIASTNTALNWSSEWADSSAYAVRYVNDLAASASGTMHLGDAMESSGGNGVLNADGTISTGGVVTDGQTGTTIYGGASNDNIAATWIKVTGGSKNIIYGGSDGCHVTDGTNVAISAGTTQFAFGAGSHDFVHVGAHNIYAVNMAVTGGKHRIVCGGGNDSVIEGDINLTMKQCFVAGMLSGAGMGDVKGDINITLNLPEYQGIRMSGNFYGGSIDLLDSTAETRDNTIDGNIRMTFTGGDYMGSIFGGSRSGGSAARVNGDVTISVAGIFHDDNVKILSQGNSAWIVGGGAADGGGSVTAGNVSISVTGSLVGRVVGGAQAQGTGSTATVLSTAITVADTFVSGDLFGGGYAYDGGLSVVSGNASITIDTTGGRDTTVLGTIYAGGANPSHTAKGGSAVVNGNASITFTGSGDQLSIGTVNGDGKVTGSVLGDRILQFADFTGGFAGRAINFDAVKFSGTTNMTMGDFEASMLEFDLREAAFADADDFSFAGDAKLKLVIDADNFSSMEFFSCNDLAAFDGIEVELWDNNSKIGTFAIGESLGKYSVEERDGCLALIG
ncbi:MAG: N-acetylmuramoyl-L-alanine amidase [Victivallaceae bacterium]|nr:N-acetylmuramoyl-L-alanine amidase [Victivallaceae bacterium]